MNTASLMTISPQAGAAVKSQTPRMVVKTDASSAGTSKETFGDVLGKAGGEAKKAMAKSPAEAQGSAIEARDAKINDDVPEGTDTLHQEAGKRGEGTPQDNEVQQDKEVKGAKERTLDAEEQWIAPAAVMAFTTEGNAQLVQKDMPVAVEVQTSKNLQSLLPQSSEDAQKNKNFLAMLSGQQIKTQGLVKDAGQVVNNQAVVEQAFSSGRKTAQETPLTAELLFKQMGMAPVKDGGAVRPGTLLEVQLGNHRSVNQSTSILLQDVPAGKVSATNVNMVLNDTSVETAVEMAPNQVINQSGNGKDTMIDAKGMALFQQSEVTMPSRAVGEVMDQTNWQQIGADARHADTMVRVSANYVVLPKDALLTDSSLLTEGENVPVAKESGKGLGETLVKLQIDVMPEQDAAINTGIDLRQTGSRSMSIMNNGQAVRNQDMPLPSMNNSRAMSSH